MKNKFWLNLFLILVGVVLGTMITHVVADVSYLSWLAFGQTFGTGAPLTLDLGILSLTFGLQVTFSVATILCIALSLLIGKFIIRE